MSLNVKHRTTRRRLLQLAGGGLAAGLAASAVEAGNRRSYFVHPSGRGDVRQAVRDHGGRVTHSYGSFAFIAGRVPPDNADDLRDDRRVSTVERDGTVEALHHEDWHDGGGGGGNGGGCSDHPVQNPSWGWTRINAETAHDDATGVGVDVAVLDTGIDEGHCDLAENLDGGYNCTGGPASRWDDKNGHGSHCAGIAAAVDNGIGVAGVAPAASLWAVKVLGNGGTGSWSDVVCGIDWCLEHGKEILSMSFGGSRNDTVAQALSTAYDAGHLLVAAAGNDGNDEDGTCEENNVGFPATHDDVIGVSAMDPDDTLAGYSSVGDGDGDGATDVDLLAPGTDIRSTYKDDGYEVLSGTSMACPHVSGTAALAWADLGADGPGTGDRNTIEDTLYSQTEPVLDTCEEGNGLVRPDRVVGALSG